ncbi:TIGR02444 family protein [bacterium SCSIO 12696]|nr:TIGR02444 family protein [bacterium SCSIO 12696]
MSDSNNNPFWNYSLALYGDIEPWCLAMQNAHGANVNLLLFCCFAGSQGYQLQAQHIEALDQVTDQWNSHVIKPLRGLRQQLPEDQLGRDYDSARQLLLAAELEAERYSQQQIWNWWQSQCDTVEATNQQPVLANLMAYGQSLSMPEPPATVIDAALCMNI